VAGQARQLRAAGEGRQAAQRRAVALAVVLQTQRDALRTRAQGGGGERWRVSSGPWWTLAGARRCCSLPPLLAPLCPLLPLLPYPFNPPKPSQIPPNPPKP